MVMDPPDGGSTDDLMELVKIRPGNSEGYASFNWREEVGKGKYV